MLVLLNAVSKKAAFIQVYDTKTWTLVQTRKVSAKPITTFALRFGFRESCSEIYTILFLCSERGGLIACGSSDMSVSLIDAQSLKVILALCCCTYVAECIVSLHLLYL